MQIPLFLVILQSDRRILTMIFYFSGTGNTRWVATQIAQTIGEELHYIPDLIRKGQYEFNTATGERIGFCFPTHGWQPPAIVRQFVRKLRVSHPDNDQDRPFCWALTTCGDNTGEAMTIFNKELSAIGLKAVTLFSVTMPESYVCLPFMYTDTEEKERRKIDNAERQLKRITEVICNRQSGIESLEKGATPRLYSYVIGGYFNKQMITDRKFTVDPDTCIKCGKCSQVCPVDNIQGTPPKWLHNGKCTCCLACYHYCPVHAVNYGSITRKRDQYYFNRRVDRK